MGILLHPLFGRGDFYQLQRLHRFLPRLLAGHFLMAAEHLHQLFPHGDYRIQAGHGFLENHGYVFSSDIAHLALGQLQQVLSVQADFTFYVTRRAFDQAHNGQRRHTLSAAGLSDDTHGLALVDVKAHIRHDLCGLSVGGKTDVQIIDLQYTFAHGLTSSISSIIWDPAHPAGRRPTGLGT